MKLLLKPNDTFFFRDARPFTRGEQSEGYSIEMPFPSTVMGALRTAYIASCGDIAQFSNEQMKPVIGTKQSLAGASIEINGVFLGHGNGALYYPTPRDLVSEKKSENAKLYSLSLAPQTNEFFSNSELSTLLTWNNFKIQVEHAEGYISCNNLRKYLVGDTQNLTSEKSDFILNEPKVGITRSHKTLATVEGMLYRINMKRFRELGFGFVVDVDGIDQLPQKGLIKLGGEGKSFTYRKTAQRPDMLSDEDHAKIRQIARDSGKFKLYLATPAIFDAGWCPGGLHQDIELVTAAVGSYVPVGGWDVANNCPKVAYRAVPAGSVYYFRFINGAKTDTVLDCLHYKNIGDQRTQEGFGLAYVGAVSRRP